MDIAMINQWAKNLPGKSYAVMGSEIMFGDEIQVSPLKGN
jgi:hypothetical protein